MARSIATELQHFGGLGAFLATTFAGSGHQGLYKVIITGYSVAGKGILVLYQKNIVYQG
jgi:hypothetical protein